jgi:hypothetical protein
MDALHELPYLTREQAERWASLSGTRLALYTEAPGWTYKAMPQVDGQWKLVHISTPRISHAMTESDAALLNPRGAEMITKQCRFPVTEPRIVGSGRSMHCGLPAVFVADRRGGSSAYLCYQHGEDVRRMIDSGSDKIGWQNLRYDES